MRQVAVQGVGVEGGVAQSEAGELAGGWVCICARGNQGGHEAALPRLSVEAVVVATQVACRIGGP